jgi:hypothetical protein
MIRPALLEIAGIVLLRGGLPISVLPPLYAAIALLTLMLISSLASKRPPASRLFAWNLLVVLILALLSAGRV